MKKINVNVDYEELVKSGEGNGFSGWIHPIWAKIEDNEIFLSTGDAVSKGTMFVDNNGCTSSSEVGDIECWNRYYNSDDAKIWANDTECDPSDFDEENELSLEIEAKASKMSDDDWEEIKSLYDHSLHGIDLTKLECGLDINSLYYNIALFAKDNGYEVLSIEF